MDFYTVVVRLLGIYLLIATVLMFTRRSMMLGVFHEIAEHRSFAMLISIFRIVLGLIIVLGFSAWDAGLAPALVTAFGWLLLAIGTVFLFFSKKHLRQMTAWFDNRVVYGALLATSAVFGLYFTYLGFF